MSTDYTIERLGGFDELNQEDWKSILAQSNCRTIFQTYDWNKLVWQFFSQGKELILLIVKYKDEKVVAIAPLYLSKEEGVKTVHIVTELCGDYADLLLDKDHSKKSLLALKTYVFDEIAPSLIAFKKIHEDSQLLSLSPDIHGKILIRDGAVCPTLIFGNETEESLTKRLKSKRIQFCRNRLNKLGEYKLLHLTKSEEIKPLLKPFYEQHIERWSVTQYPSKFLDRNYRAFFESLVEFLGPNNEILFSALYLDEKPLAFHFGLCSEGHFIWYKPSYNINEGKFSPGQVILKECMEHVIKDGYVEFDFAAGNEAYKHRFANIVRKNCDIIMYRSIFDYLTAVSGHNWLAIKQVVKKIINK